MQLNLDTSTLEEHLRQVVAEEVERHRNLLAGDRWLNTEQAADYLGCSKGRLHNLTSAGRIPFHREGGRLVFSQRELDDWIRSGKAAA